MSEAYEPAVGILHEVDRPLAILRPKESPRCSSGAR
jgi:hypothetical protein